MASPRDKKDQDKKQKQEQLSKLRRDYVLDAMRYLPTGSRSKKSSEKFMEQQSLAHEFIHNIQAIDIEHDEKADEQLRKMKEAFDKKISPSSSPMQTAFHDPNVSYLLTSFLTPKDQAMLKRAGRLGGMKVAQNTLGKEQLREPLLNALRQRRWLYSFAGDVEVMTEQDERKAVDDILNRLEAKSPDTNFEELFLKYQKLERFLVTSLSEDQLTLLSSNVAVARRWVKDNFYRLREPLDNRGNCALHYLAFSGHVKILEELQKQKIDIRNIKNFSNIPIQHLAGLGGSIDKRMRDFFRENDMGIYDWIKTYSGKMVSPCMLAILGSNVDTAKYLFRSSSRLEKDLLMKTAVLSGDINMVRLCRDEFKCDTGPHFPLDIAAGGNIEMVRITLPESSYKKATDDKGYGFQFYAPACTNVRSAIQMLVFAKEELKCDMQTKGFVEDQISHWCAAHGRGKTLKYIISQMGLDPKAVDNNGTSIQHLAVMNVNIETLIVSLDEFKCDMKAVDNHFQGVQHFSFLSGHLPTILVCQLLELDMDARSASGADIVDFAKHSKTPDAITLAKLIKSYPSSYANYPPEYQSEWNAKAKESMADHVAAVLDSYINQPLPPSARRTWFATGDPHPYRDEAKALKIRVLECKDQNPVELFFCLNYQLLDLMNRRNIAPDLNDPLIICIRFATNRVLENIHALRLTARDYPLRLHP